MCVAGPDDCGAGCIETFFLPFRVVLLAHAAIAAGTLAGGWRIIHTMGSKITKLQPVGGFAAETSAAISLFIETHRGYRLRGRTPVTVFRGAVAA